MTGLGNPSGVEFSVGERLLRCILELMGCATQQPLKLHNPTLSPVPIGGCTLKDPPHHLIDELLRRPRQPIIAGPWCGAYQRESEYTVGRLQPDHLSDHSPHRTSDQMGPVDPQPVKKSESVDSQIIEVIGIVGRELCGTPAVTVIKPEHPITGCKKRVDNCPSPSESGAVGAGQQDHDLTAAGALEICPEPHRAAIDQRASCMVGFRVRHDSRRYPHHP